MAVKNFRIGNDLVVLWAICNRDGSPYDLANKHVRLYVINERGRREVDPIITTLPDGTINNVIRWDFNGMDQRVTGLYTLSVEILTASDKKSIKKDYCEAFNLVGSSSLEDESLEENISDGGELILSSSLDVIRLSVQGEFGSEIDDLKDSLKDINDALVGINQESVNIKATINGIQSIVNDIGTELVNKASVESVTEIGASITEIQNNQYEQSVKLDVLGTVISTKASSESVTKIADVLVITNNTLAEQTTKVNDIEVQITNKAEASQVTEIEDGLKAASDSIAEQNIKVSALESQISTKAETETVTQLGESINIVSENVAEQIIRTDGIEASIENLVTNEVFNAATGEIESSITSVEQRTDSIETTIKSQGGEITSIKENVNGLSVGIGNLESDLDSLRNQLDGVTESFFHDYSPTNDNEPAKTWIEQGKQAEHKGDTFTNTATEGDGAGKSWRWLQDNNGNWGWHPIADTDAQKALVLAAQAQATADGKVSIFYIQPSNYKEGDIWFVHNDEYSPYEKGEILTAIAGGTIFSLSDWESKTRYTEAVKDLDKTMNTTFKDGVLDEAERLTIIEGVTALTNEKSAVDARYNITIVNSDFTDETLKNEYKTTKATYDSAYNSLVGIVEQIADAKAEGLKDLFDSYTTASENYTKAYSAHNEKETQVTEALMGRLNSASRYLDNITNDGILTPIEKEQLFEIYRNIAREYDATRSNALNYKVWKYSNDGVTEESGLNGGEGRYNNYIAFKSAYNNVASVFSSSIWGFTQMKESTTLPEGYTTTLLKEYLDTYYEAYGILTESFSAITAAIEAAQKAAEETLQGLTDNLRPEEMSTIVGKGVVLSTIIATKDGSGKLTAGINGSLDQNKGEKSIAAWFGGDVVDVELDTDKPNPASSVIRHDGTGYFAKGLFSWDGDTGINLGRGGININYDGSLDFGDDIRIGGTETLGSLLKIVSKLSSMWRLEDGVLKTNYDVLTNGQFAAAAVGTEGGGSVGAAYLSDLYDVSLGSLLSGDILSWNGSEWVNIKQSSLVPDLSGYLPKSGGTLSGNLLIGAENNTAYNYIRIWRNNKNIELASAGDIAVLSFNGVGFAFNETQALWNGNTLIHSGNYSDYALPLTGGRISGNLDINSETDTTRRYFRMWYYASNRKNRGMMSVDENAVNLDYYSETDGRYDYISIGRNGFKYSANYVVNDVLHTGNIGDYAFIPRAQIVNNTNADDLLTNGVYLNAIGSGSGNSNFPNSYGTFLTFAQEDRYAAQLSVGDRYLYFRRKLDTWSDWYEIIHSGNIGSQSVAEAKRIKILGELTSSVFDANTALSGGGAMRNYGDVSWWGSTMPSMSYGVIYQLQGYPDSDQLAGQFAWDVKHRGSDSTGNLWWRANDDQGFTNAKWHQIAFTDSNVAGAQKLVDANGSPIIQNTGATFYVGDTIFPNVPTHILGKEIALRYGASATNGLILNSSGNVTIGAGDFASTTAKLYVAGNLRLEGELALVGGYSIQSYNSAPLSINAQGNNILLNEKGYSNVLIGTTSDSGHKLQVNGTVNLFEHSIDNVSEIRCYDSGTGYFVGKRNNGLGATDGGLLLFSYGATPMSFYTDSAERMRINSSGNVTIGDNDYAGTSAKLYVNGGIRFAPRTIWGQSFDGTGDVDGVLTTTEEFIIDTTKYSGGYWARGIVWKQNDTELGNLCYMSVSDRRISIVHGAYDSSVGLHILSNGYAGLGVVSPNTALHVKTSSHLGITVESSGNSESSIVYKDSSAREWIAGIGVGAIDNSFGFWTNTNLMTVMSLQSNGNVLIGTRDDRGYKLDVAGDVRVGSLLTPANLTVCGNTRVYRRNDNRTYLDLICEDVVVNYEAYDTDGFCKHNFKSNGKDLMLLDGSSSIATFYGSLTVQSGITTNEITIGGIKLDVYNGALRVNGDIFSTGQFAASVAGEATGGSNIVLDYASIVNALGYTPANNNNLAQVAFTGSYADLSNKPTSLPASDVYSWAKASVKPTYSWSEIQSRPDVYTKQEVDDKLSDIEVGGGEGCNCDENASGLGDTIPLSDLNENSYDVPNGVNCVMVNEDATLYFSSVIPLDPSRPCIMYLVKTDSYTLQVTYSSNITSANSSGGLSEQFSVDGYTGMMLVWDTDYWKWHAYIQKM